MHRVRGAFGWLLAAAVLSISFVPILADETSPATTRIKIDGRSADWVDRPIVGQDSLADAEPGCIELGTVRAFVNRNALYFLIELDVTDRACEQFDIEVSAGHRTLLLSWSPGGDRGFLGDVSHGYEAIGEAALSVMALGPNLEGRIDLRDLGSPDRVSLHAVRAMVGSCCEWPAWRAGDEWKSRQSTPVVDEIDEAAGGSARSSTAENPFGLPEGWTWDYMMVPAAADITGIVRSGDGTIFVQHSGLSPAISVLDAKTGVMKRILELPPEASTYRTIVEGPGDTIFAIIPRQNVVWQVSSDGAYEVWGRAPRAWPFLSTDGEFLLGRSHEGGLIRMYPDGTTEPISDAFDHIDSIVQIGDRLFVSDIEQGSIVRIDPDGTHHTLVERILYRDPMDLAATPAGDLYLSSVATGFVKVDQETGQMSPAPISGGQLCTVHPADVIFSSPSTALFADPTESQIVWLDINSGQHGILAGGEGANSWALAIGADDALYVGVNGCGDAPAKILRYGPQGDSRVYASGIRGEIKDIAVDAADGLYVATHDPQTGAAPMYYLPSDTHALERIWGIEGVHTLTVDPTTSRAYGADWHGERLLEFDRWSLWKERSLSLPKPAEDAQIACGPGGTLYMSCSGQENAETGPVVERWILRIDTTADRGEIVVQKDRSGCCVMSNCCAAPDGTLWWLLNPDFGLYRVTPDSGRLELFAHSLPIDPAAVAVDRHGTVFVTSPSGIIRFAPPGTDTD